MNELRRGEAGLSMICGADVVATGGEWMPGSSQELAHFGIKGMKHGERRYQTASGEWTPLGLKERRAREGFGEGKKGSSGTTKGGKKSGGDAKSSSGPTSLRSLFKRKDSAKNLSVDDLKDRISRMKLENEYLELQKANRELNKSPLLETAQKLVQSYSDAKNAKLAREEKRYQLENSRISSLAALRKAQADKISAKNDLIDNITGGKGRKEAKVKLLESKSKHTITGALRDVANRVINKEGNRLVKEMGPNSLTMKAGRAVKNTTKNAVAKGKQLAKDVYQAAGDIVLDIKYGKTGGNSGAVTKS